MMDMSPWITPDYTSSTNGLSALLDGLNTLLMGGRLSTNAEAIIFNYLSNRLTARATHPLRQPR